MQPCTNSDGVMACMEPWRGTPCVAVQRALMWCLPISALSPLMRPSGPLFYTSTPSQWDDPTFFRPSLMCRARACPSGVTYAPSPSHTFLPLPRTCAGPELVQEPLSSYKGLFNKDCERWGKGGHAGRADNDTVSTGESWEGQAAAKALCMIPLDISHAPPMHLSHMFLFHAEGASLPCIS